MIFRDGDCESPQPYLNNSYQSDSHHHREKERTPHHHEQQKPYGDYYPGRYFFRSAYILPVTRFRSFDALTLPCHL
ncbi:hypothetical protein D3C71_1375550 [compost metagenome]